MGCFFLERARLGRMQEPDLEGWRRDQLADHELPAISRARNAAWSLREAPPAQNLPGRGVSVALVAVAALQSVLTSGIVFGWAPLQLMLRLQFVTAQGLKRHRPPSVNAVSSPRPARRGPRAPVRAR